MAKTSSFILRNVHDCHKQGYLAGGICKFPAKCGFQKRRTQSAHYTPGLAPTYFSICTNPKLEELNKK